MRFENHKHMFNLSKHKFWIEHHQLKIIGLKVLIECKTLNSKVKKIKKKIKKQKQRKMLNLLREREERIGKNLSISYRKEPLHIVEGKGQYLYDTDGNRYLDCVNNVAHVGHSHPKVVQAASNQLSIINTNTRYLSNMLIDYAKKLTDTLPPSLSVCFFVCSGSEANDLAMRLAMEHTKGTDFLVMDHAYHGHTISTIDLSPYKFNRKGI